MILPIHQRLAELRSFEKQRSLTDDELMEYEQCLDVNVALCWKMAKYENFFKMAYEVMDKEWMHESCVKIEEIKYGNKKT